MKQVAGKLDKSLQDKQHAAQIRSVQAALFPPQELLAPARRLLFKGILVKVGKRSESKRMFWLFNDILVCGQPSGNTLYKHKHTVKLMQEQGTDQSAGGDAKQREFTITGEERSFTLRAASAAQKQEWLGEVQKCLKLAREQKEQREREQVRHGARASVTLDDD